MIENENVMQNQELQRSFQAPNLIGQQDSKNHSTSMPNLKIYMRLHIFKLLLCVINSRNINGIVLMVKASCLSPIVDKPFTKSTLRK